MNKKLNAQQRREIKATVEEAFSKYRLYRGVFLKRQASVTANYDRESVMTSNITDSTADTSIYNVDGQRNRTLFCERVEQAVESLPEKERFLIEQRYMCEDADYVTDYQVYCFEFNPPISERTYAKIRERAFIKLTLLLKLDCGFDLMDIV